MTKATAPATPEKHSRLTSRQWAEAEALWESGDVTYAQLTARFGKHKSTFVDHFRRKGVRRGSKKEEHAAAVKEEVKKASIDEATVLAARIKETKEEHYKMASGLAKLTWNEILKAKADGLPFGSVLNNLKSLDSAMTVLKKAREERWAVLGLDKDTGLDEDGLPELVISELTADQIEALRNRDEEDMGESEIDTVNAELDDLDDEVVEEGDDGE
ncbi:hypothetical protein [Paraburkholderia sp.]|uniref:hypothetical protein n=1 Tax=Paraburkholderia sp. TaxID=1926495 RepID=UPI0039E5D0D7